ncbi:hypothetical protein [Sporisorium scitamineum]|uniref:Uncharacterized protein n=1 Tax=Sporisorium scitamineum TaxID=49012 RepID=A0A0F7S390_9BASI|nr:hypothetical protein [Sporisorium scitamineum]
MITRTAPAYRLYSVGTDAIDTAASQNQDEQSINQVIVSMSSCVSSIATPNATGRK